MQDPERRPLPRPRRYKERKEKPVYEEEEYNNTYVEENDKITHALPANGLRFALLAGLVASLIIALINFLVPFLNVQAFNLAATQLDKMNYNTAFTVTSLNCLSLFLAITVCSFLGYFVGKYVVQRRLGFIAGFTAGFIFRLFSSIWVYIPGYPGTTTAPAFTSPYMLALLVTALIYGCGGGLLSLLATWITTRKHPYYTRSVDYS